MWAEKGIKPQREWTGRQQQNVLEATTRAGQWQLTLHRHLIIPQRGRPEAGWSGSDNSGTAWEPGSKLNSEAGDAHEAGTEFFSSIRENSVG